MRYWAFCLALVTLLVSAAVGEILVPANTIPQGKFAVEGVYLSDSNVSNVSSTTLGSYGIKGAYGITNDLELDLALGTGTYSNLPAGLGVSGMSIYLQTVVLRYQIVKESASSPVTVTAGAGYKMFNQVATVPGLGNLVYPGGKSGLGVIVSKVMAPFIPYGGLSYHTLSVSGTNSIVTELTLGSGIAWSKQGMVCVEYTNQAYSASGTNYTSPQIGIGVLYVI